MLAEVKSCADKGDIKGLRYIFVDCLDVDPTFEKYKDDYEYCKKIPGMFDTHQELNELVENEKLWDKEYWDQLKNDLMKNFSQKRFEHMITVAKIVHADKVARLIRERDEKRRGGRQQNESESLESPRKDIRSKGNIKTNESLEGSLPNGCYSEEDIEKLKKKYAEEYERDVAKEREEREEREKIKALKKASQQQNNIEDDFPGKKWLGVVLIVAVVVVIVMVLAFQGNNPQ